MADDRGSVLVTGGARRIGRAICEALAARGWRVVVHSRRADDPDATALADRLGGKSVSCDLAAPQAAETLFSNALAAAPDLVAIVNNAAVFSVAATLPPDEAERMTLVNARVPSRLAELLADHLRTSGRCGAVVDLLDSRILSTTVAETPYVASKRMLLDEIRAGAMRLAPTVRVNGVAPGPVLVPEDAANREKGGAVLLARRPAPEDVAKAVAFLMEADAVTGQVLAVDSGQSLM